MGNAQRDQLQTELTDVQGCGLDPLALFTDAMTAQDRAFDGRIRQRRSEESPDPWTTQAGVGRMRDHPPAGETFRCPSAVVQPRSTAQTDFKHANMRCLAFYWPSGKAQRFAVGCTLSSVWRRLRLKATLNWPAAWRLFIMR